MTDNWHTAVKHFLKRSGGLRDGDLIGLAIHLDRARLYVRHNTTWIGGPPGSGTPTVHITRDREYVASVEVGSPDEDYSKSDTWTANFGATPFAHALPQGYEPYGGRR